MGVEGGGGGVSIFIKQLFINNHTIFMQDEAALLWWLYKNYHINAIRRGRGPARGGGGGMGRGKRHCTLVHIPVYMNRVLPKWYKEVYSYHSLDCTVKKGLLHGMSYTPEKKSCMKSLTLPAG